MSDGTGKPARWEWVPVDVAMPLGEGEAHGSARIARTYDLTDATGQPIGRAVASVDLRRRLITVRELRYDASRATEDEARRALARFVAPPVAEVEAEAEPAPADQ